MTYRGPLCGPGKPWGNPPKAEGAKPLSDQRQKTSNFSERKVDLPRRRVLRTLFTFSLLKAGPIGNCLFNIARLLQVSKLPTDIFVQPRQTDSTKLSAALSFQLRNPLTQCIHSVAKRLQSGFCRHFLSRIDERTNPFNFESYSIQRNFLGACLS